MSSMIKRTLKLLIFIVVISVWFIVITPILLCTITGAILIWAVTGIDRIEDAFMKPMDFMIASPDYIFKKLGL